MLRRRGSPRSLQPPLRSSSSSTPVDLRMRISSLSRTERSQRQQHWRTNPEWTLKRVSWRAILPQGCWKRQTTGARPHVCWPGRRSRHSATAYRPGGLTCSSRGAVFGPRRTLDRPQLPERDPLRDRWLGGLRRSGGVRRLDRGRLACGHQARPCDSRASVPVTRRKAPRGVGEPRARPRDERCGRARCCPSSRGGQGPSWTYARRDGQAPSKRPARGRPPRAQRC